LSGHIFVLPSCYKSLRCHRSCTGLHITIIGRVIYYLLFGLLFYCLIHWEINWIFADWVWSLLFDFLLLKSRRFILLYIFWINRLNFLISLRCQSDFWGWFILSLDSFASRFYSMSMNSTSGAFGSLFISILIRSLCSFKHWCSRLTPFFLGVLYVYRMVLRVLIKLEITVIDRFCSFMQITFGLTQFLDRNRVQNLGFCHLLPKSSIDV
jgi:hypothetical protein